MFASWILVPSVCICWTASLIANLTGCAVILASPRTLLGHIDGVSKQAVIQQSSAPPYSLPAAAGDQPLRSSRVSVATLKREYGKLRSAQNLRQKALATYRLNDEADQYAHQLNQSKAASTPDKFMTQAEKAQAEKQVRIANRYGASIIRCEYSGTWTARPLEYLKYLSLSPKGPDAEEAWWRAKLGRRTDGCFDAEGSEEETASFVHDYEQFLKQFPHGTHEREAREKLSELEADLKWWKQQKTQ